MAKPSDRAIAMAFWETREGLKDAMTFSGEVLRRAREIDAATPEGAHPARDAEFVDGVVQSMRTGPRHLWRCDLVGDGISIQRMTEIVSAALAAAAGQGVDRG